MPSGSSLDGLLGTHGGLLRASRKLVQPLGGHRGLLGVVWGILGEFLAILGGILDILLFKESIRISEGLP